MCLCVYLCLCVCAIGWVYVFVYMCCMVCVPKVGAIVSVWPLMSTHSPPVSYMVPNCTKLGLLYVLEN